jgi:ATP-binding cassette subfamily F protein uup
LIVGEIEPDAGWIRRGARIEIAYFDQLREQLDDDATIVDTISQGAEYIEIGGARKHVMSYLGDFLFRPDRARAKVSALSGGERNRLLLARLFSRPANVLVLDEPTNDLDIETLELLEESLLEFPGALVLVTHDRYLLDRVSTTILALDGVGGAVSYADYGQWEAGRLAELEAAARRSGRTRPSREDEPAQQAASPRRKRGYLAQREWDEMEGRILAAEERLSACRRAAEDPAVASDHVALAARLAELTAAQAEVEGLYARWAELEDE